MPIRVPVDWDPRSYQLPLWQFMENGGKRAVSVWHRRAGKDATALNFTVTRALQEVGLYWHMLPTYNQGRKIVWDGRTRDGRPFLSAWPEEYIESKNETDMRIKLKNGSIWQVVGTDNVDRLVGVNVLGCVLSEYSLQDPRAWDLIRPILAENNGWAMFLYTPRGKNHGYNLLQIAQNNVKKAKLNGVPSKWFVQVLTCKDTKRPDGTPVISEEAIQEERDGGMPEETIQQEFYCSFSGSILGAYYAKQMKAAADAVPPRITKVPWVPNQMVYTFWDLGMDDSTTIWFAQIIGKEYRFIDYYENSGEGLAHYAKILAAKPYVYGDHYMPHDVEVREMGTGTSRKNTAKALGIKPIITVSRAKDTQSVLDGIEACRNILAQCWFDEVKCQRGITALEGYQAKWDEEKKVFLDHPEHDWTAHGADAFRTFGVGYRDKPKRIVRTVTSLMESRPSIGLM